MRSDVTGEPTKHRYTPLTGRTPFEMYRRYQRKGSRLKNQIYSSSIYNPSASVMAINFLTDRGIQKTHLKNALYRIITEGRHQIKCEMVYYTAEGVFTDCRTKRDFEFD